MVIIWGVSLILVELILLYGGAKFESYKGKLNVVLGLKECTLFIVEAKLHDESRGIQRCFDDNKDDNKI